MFENEYNDLEDEMPLSSISACMFLLLTYLGGMQGFEAVWTHLAALISDLRRRIL